MKKFLTCSLLVVVALAMVLTVSPAEAAEWPGERDVRYVVPYEPGGLSDITARLMGEVLREEGMWDWEVSDFVITNIAGASAGNAMVEVRDADPDGSMLLHHHTSFITHMAFGVRDWSYEEFTPIAMLFEVPQVAFALPGEWEDFNEYVEYVEENPGETTFAGSSLGGGTHMMGEMLLDAAGIRDDLSYVAHGGGGPMTAAMLGGEDEMAVTQAPTVLPPHPDGDFEILGVSSEERLDSIPDVPTFEELGYDLPLTTTHRMGVWGPPGMDQELVDEIADFFEELVTSETFKERAADQGLFVNFQDGETLREYFEEDEETIYELIDEYDLDE
ncbi:Bug family tripartite tricarboxylate transporter substrate binding protein [Halarsenatibacter silvermanii]|uniref:Tripartite-type tricarboxylate transporter, receptor component TctC n=1 Tax=Halarsenatibacter silvermanii TaxID=321763 RepID=A0A1G9QH98_9FIRM|nr:tripartite tricarboxylate transporter substrate binding protein [Halarsenatibacter silvermanii]SDM09857.1 Tripartite-type tricarboxylate transporter, receptor component TctC [Halarsenatibacter silvermanii]